MRRRLWSFGGSPAEAPRASAAAPRGPVARTATIIDPMQLRGGQHFDGPTIEARPRHYSVKRNPLLLSLNADFSSPERR
jgi:hypothetical protein